MTTVDLDAIRARHVAFEAAWDHEFCGPDGPKCAAASAEDVPALLAAIERIQALADSMEREAPKPAIGGHLADQIRMTLRGES